MSAQQRATMMQQRSGASEEEEKKPGQTSTRSKRITKENPARPVTANTRTTQDDNDDSNVSSSASEFAEWISGETWLEAALRLLLTSFVCSWSCRKLVKTKARELKRDPLKKSSKK